MKVIDILSESTVTEAPVGTLGQVGRRLGAGVLGALGMKNTAASIAGKADQGTRANQYYTAYRKYLGQTGKDEQSATYADVANFLKTNQLNPAYVRNLRGPVIKAELDQIFVQMATDYFQGKSGPGGGGRNQRAGQAAAGTANTPAGQPGAQAAQPGAQQAAPNTPTGQTASQPFSIPALIQVIPQMNKRDLNRLNRAIQAALQNPQAAAQQARAAASSASNATAGMTAAQTRAVRQAQAANATQAQPRRRPAAAPTLAPLPPGRTIAAV